MRAWGLPLSVLIVLLQGGGGGRGIAGRSLLFLQVARRKSGCLLLFAPIAWLSPLCDCSSHGGGGGGGSAGARTLFKRSKVFPNSHTQGGALYRVRFEKTEEEEEEEEGDEAAAAGPAIHVRFNRKPPKVWPLNR